MDSVNYGERLADVRERIARAAAVSGRPACEIILLAVSKNHPAEAVSALARLGQRDFGENYVQEALAKQESLEHLDLRWHFIGHLQSNKARFVAGRFSLIHSLDSRKLAQGLHDSCAKVASGAGEAEFRQDVLIQVNLGAEPQKSGVMAENLERLAEEVMSLKRLSLQGLMCLPPLFEGPEESRPYFARLRELREALSRKMGLDLPHLSMGMSMDFEAAIEEGSTIVRVGTDLFGDRPGKRQES